MTICAYIKHDNSSYLMSDKRAVTGTEIFSDEYDKTFIVKLNNLTFTSVMAGRLSDIIEFKSVFYRKVAANSIAGVYCAETIDSLVSALKELMTEFRVNKNTNFQCILNVEWNEKNKNSLLDSLNYTFTINIQEYILEVIPLKVNHCIGSARYEALTFLNISQNYIERYNLDVDINELVYDMIEYVSSKDNSISSTFNLIKLS